MTFLEKIYFPKTSCFLSRLIIQESDLKIRSISEILLLRLKEESYK